MVAENDSSNYTCTFNFLDHYDTERRITNFPRVFKKGGFYSSSIVNYKLARSSEVN